MLLARVRRTVITRGLVSRGERVLCAISGGPDSAAMLDVLARLAPSLGIAIEAASVDHQLRAGSAADVELARAQAAARDVAFHALRVEVGREASMQAAARRARYAALHTLAVKIGAARIATAHTLDDQAETVIARLLRGAGPLGLAGIAPRRRDGVVRPLIDASRAEVLAWIDAHAIEVARDPSNEDPRYLRARVRRAHLPALMAESASLPAHLARLADDARALRRAVRGDARALLVRAERDGALELASLREASEPVRREALRAWSAVGGARPIGRSHVEALEHMIARPERAEVRLPANRLAFVSEGWLRCRVTAPIKNDETPANDRHDD